MGSIKRPIRVLHVVGGMNRGGVETWLMHVLRRIDRSQFRMDFLVLTDQPCAYDEEVLSLGSRIIRCPNHKNILEWGLRFRKALKENGPYDVLHSHVHHFSGYILFLAHSVGVPVRIAHSHSDTSQVQANAPLLRRSYFWIMQKLIRKYSTTGLACSSPAAKALFGPDWQEDRCLNILYCGIDLEPFREKVDKQAIRSSLSIPQNAFVVGHVGRFEIQKNHTFLVDIAAEVCKQRDDMVFLLVGDGPLRSDIERKVNSFGLADRFVFTGSRSDVPQLMKGAMDLFLFPSRFEGLSLAIIEAQAAGLPCLVSDVITVEVDIVPGLVRRFSLDRSSEDWADEVIKFTNPNVLVNYLAYIEESPFVINKSIADLSSIYDE